MNPIEKYTKLLESLKVKKDQGPAEMCGIRFDESLESVEHGVRCDEDDLILYLFERCRRAEENAKSETLLEDVKEVVRLAMEAAAEETFQNDLTDRTDAVKFRRLSEPETRKLTVRINKPTKLEPISEEPEMK